GYDIDGFGLMCVDVDDEAKVGREIAANLDPVFSGIIGAHNIPVLLHEQSIGARAVHGDAVHAMADLRRSVGNVERMQTSINGFPCRAFIIATKRASCGYGDIDPPWIAGIEQNRMQAHAARTRLPTWT